MKAELFLAAMSDIDSKYIEEALDYERKLAAGHRGVRKSAICAAACVLIAVSIILPNAAKRSQIAVYMGDAAISETAQPVLERNRSIMTLSLVEPISVELRLDSKREADLSVSAGYIELIDDKSGENSPAGTEFSCPGDSLVRWRIDCPDISEEYELYIVSGGRETTVKLSYDNETGKWTIFKG